MLWPIRGAPGRGPELTLSLLGLLLLDPLINFVEAAELCIQYAVLLGDLWRARAAEARGRVSLGRGWGVPLVPFLAQLWFSCRASITSSLDGSEEAESSSLQSINVTVL